MSQRKDDILEAAMNLFAKQGFLSTSVQEITDASGMSKGAFYKHFDSKESMMLDLLQRFYHDLWNEPAKEHDTSEEFDSKLCRSLRIELEKSMEYRSFFHILYTELSPHEGGPISDYLNHMRGVLYNWHHYLLLNTFGRRAEPYLHDLTVMLEGMMHAYLVTMIWDGKKLPLGKLAAFLVQRTEAIVQQDYLIEPMLSADSSETTNALQGITSIINELEALLTEIKEQAPIEDTSKYIQTVKFLLEELNQEMPRSFLVDALLAQVAEHPNLKQQMMSIKTKWELWKEGVSTL